MNPHRAERIKRAVEAGIRGWQPSGAANGPKTQSEAPHDADVVRPMARRQPLNVVDAAHVDLPMAHRVVFKPGIIRPFLRLFVWLWACIRFFGGNAVDRFHGRASTERSAVRLREVFDNNGVSFAKL